MMQIPNVIEDMIFKDYLTINDIKFINKYTHNIFQIKKNKAQHIIYKYVFKYIKGYQHVQNIDYYHIPKYIYKKYYPLKYKQEFIHKASIQPSLTYQNKLLIDELINSNISIVSRFNTCIDILSESQLYNIGW